MGGSSICCSWTYAGLDETAGHHAWDGLIGPIPDPAQIYPGLIPNPSQTSRGRIVPAKDDQLSLARPTGPDVPVLGHRGRLKGRLPVPPVGRLPVPPVGRLPVPPVGRLPVPPATESDVQAPSSTRSHHEELQAGPATRLLGS